MFRGYWLPIVSSLRGVVALFSLVWPVLVRGGQ
jgi:hypothetical protein